MFFFALNFLLIVVFSFGQLNHLFTFWGIQTDLALVSVVVFSLFEKDWLRRCSLILLAILILGFEPVFGFNTVFITAVFFLSVFLLDILKWEPAFNTILTILIATILMNAGAFHVEAVVTEALFNLLFAVPLALFMSLAFPRFKN